MPAPEHPETDTPQAVRHPVRVAVRNSISSLAVLAVAAGVILLLFKAGDKAIDQKATCWAVASVGFSAIVVCAGHAFLGAWIGAHRANNVLRALLALAFIVFLFYLRRWRLGGDG